MPTRMLKTKKVSDAILEEIRRMILSGEIKEGDKLPNQNEFAAQLGVSRPSLREALQVLSQLGAIQQRPGAGTVLISRTPALFSSQMNLPLLSDEAATVELMEARRMVEVGLAGMAAERATAEERKEMGRVLGLMDKARKKGDKAGYSENDVIFHHLVATAARNRFGLAMYKNLNQAFAQLLTDTFSVLPEMVDVSYQYHERIFGAIEEHSPQRAAEAMAEHIQSGITSLSTFYSRREQEEAQA